MLQRKESESLVDQVTMIDPVEKSSDTQILVKIVVPFRSSSNESNIIDAIKEEWRYKMNKSNNIGNR